MPVGDGEVAQGKRQRRGGLEVTACGGEKWKSWLGSFDGPAVGMMSGSARALLAAALVIGYDVVLMVENRIGLGRLGDWERRERDGND
ncbi:hypothetical protein M0R45_026492 [Rubus argutus]|uniref:Uncharacterized protein n=1 Tax=Rubus argutus TaxID=59490 RepID=A0AAW1WX99_RUBAR